MLFRPTGQLKKLFKVSLLRASWDTKELTIPKDDKPIISLKYDPKYISILGFHNTITVEKDIICKLRSD